MFYKVKCANIDILISLGMYAVVFVQASSDTDP